MGNYLYVHDGERHMKLFKKKEPVTRCRFCKKYIYDTASFCPHCNSDIDGQFSRYEYEYVRQFCDGEINELEYKHLESR